MSKFRLTKILATVGLMYFGALLILAQNEVQAEETSPWTYVGGDTYTGKFVVPTGDSGESKGVWMYCVMVRNPQGMAKGASAISCK